MSERVCRCVLVRVSVCLSASLPLCLSVSLPLCLSASLPLCLSVSVSVTHAVLRVGTEQVGVDERGELLPPGVDRRVGLAVLGLVAG